MNRINNYTVEKIYQYKTQKRDIEPSIAIT